MARFPILALGVGLLCVGVPRASKALEPEDPEIIDVVGVTSSAPDPASETSMLTVIQVDERVPADADVADVVDMVPGARINRLGGLGDFSAVSIRGSSFRQVEVFVDGVPLNPDGATAINLSELPLRSFSRVEVYRGGGPPSLGANAMGGVVHLVTEPLAGRSPVSRASFSMGSFDTMKAAGSVGFAERIGDLPIDGFAAVDALATQGRFRYFSDGGTPYTLVDDRLSMRENNDHRRMSVNGRVRLGHPQLRLTALTSWSWVDEGVPGPAYRPTEDVRYGAVRGLGTVKVEGIVGPFSASGDVWGVGLIESFDDRDGEIGVGSQWTTDRSALVGSRGRLTWAALDWLQAQANADVRVDVYSHADRLTGTRAPARTRVVGKMNLGATGWWLPYRGVNGLSVTTSVHLLGVESSGLRLESAKNGRFEAMPRFGWVVRPHTWLAIKGNVGRYLRPPDLVELFGDRGALIGNPELVAEHGWNLDVGARLAPDVQGPAEGWVEGVFFFNEGQDLISYIQNAQGVALPVNLGETRVLGVETAGYLHLVNMIETGFDFTWTWSRNLSQRHPATTYAQLPRVPRLELSGHVALHWHRQLRGGYRLSYTDGNYWDATNWFLAAPRTFHGVFASVRLGPDRPRQGRPGGPWLEVDVRNLTNRLAQVVPRNPLEPSDGALAVQPVTDFMGFPLPGRTVLVTLTFEEP